MTGTQFLANNCAQLLLEIAAQIDAGLAKDAAHAEVLASKDARIAELEDDKPKLTAELLTE